MFLDNHNQEMKMHPRVGVSLGRKDEGGPPQPQHRWVDTQGSTPRLPLNDVWYAAAYPRTLRPLPPLFTPPAFLGVTTAARKASSSFLAAFA